MAPSFILAVKSIMLRELDNLHTEISAYQVESDLWKVSGQISNSAANLSLHICGNLKHFIGAVLGNDGYVRKREFEFSAKDISRNDLLKEISSTKVSVEHSLDVADPQIIIGNYPLHFHGQSVKTDWFLIHLTAHLQYHLGQINYHRRLLSSSV